MSNGAVFASSSYATRIIGSDNRLQPPVAACRSTDELHRLHISSFHGPPLRAAAGNTGATIEGPCMFDPASFFGHSEFELAIMDMFGGFQEPFWAAYHAKVQTCCCILHI